LINKEKIKSSDVLFAFDDGQTKIYFTKTGVVYTFNKVSPKQIEKDDDEDADALKSHAEMEKEEHAITITTDIKYMNWENANPSAEVIASDPVSDYFSYSFYEENNILKNINYIKGYNKITYKDIYPDIDVEFTFHPTEGIKYSLILHPGADISNIKLNYLGDPALIVNGNLHISTLFGDIIDHAPLSFYADNKSATIHSTFIKTKIRSHSNWMHTIIQEQ